MRLQWIVPLMLAAAAVVLQAQAPATSNTTTVPGRAEIRLTYLGPGHRWRWRESALNSSVRS